MKVDTQTQFELDLVKPLTINGNKSCKGFYNLVVSIRDMKLYCKGMKANRFWKISHVKDYFGVKGNKESVLEQLIVMRDEIFPKN
jgi:hypothetical protein